jgi:hypothetical protein
MPCVRRLFSTYRICSMNNTLGIEGQVTPMLETPQHTELSGAYSAGSLGACIPSALR